MQQFSRRLDLIINGYPWRNHLHTGGKQIRLLKNRKVTTSPSEADIGLNLSVWEETWPLPVAPSCMCQWRPLHETTHKLFVLYLSETGRRLWAVVVVSFCTAGRRQSGGHQLGGAASVACFVEDSWWSDEWRRRRQLDHFVVSPVLTLTTWYNITHSTI